MFKNYIYFYLFKDSECCEFYNDNEKMTVLCKNAASYPIFPWKLKDLKQFSRSSGTKKLTFTEYLLRGTCEERNL